MIRMDYTKQWFERLFKDSYPHMYRMAYSMVEDADDAKDAVHQVFAQIWKGKPKVSASCDNANCDCRWRKNYGELKKKAATRSTKNCCSSCNW